MTNQEKKQYLSQYRTNELEILRLEQELMRWESRARKVTAGWGGVPGSCGDNRMQACIDKIVELQNRLRDQIAAGVTLRGAMITAINTVPEERLRQLLRYRYIDGMTWERIAVTMHYDTDGRNVYKLHGKALTLIKLDTVLHLKSVIQLS